MGNMGVPKDLAICDENEPNFKSSLGISDLMNSKMTGEFGAS